MKSVHKMSLAELAAWVCSHLSENGIEAVLSGGGCVSIYSSNQYQSMDLDFVENISSSRQKIKRILAEIGFHEEHRYFEHPETRFIQYHKTISLADGPSCAYRGIPEIGDRDF
jgi:hypothetical protein